MRPRDIAQSYDRIAARWISEDFDPSYGIRQHELAIRLAPSRGAALDVGCGSSSRLLDLLAAHGFSAEGLDFSSEMLKLARAANPALPFHHADVCEWTPPHTYDFISAWDSLWHVPLIQQRAVLQKLCAALAPGGVFIFSAGGLETANEHVDQHMGVPMYHATLGVPQIYDALAEAGCAVRHFEQDQPPSQHVFFVVQRVPPSPSPTTDERSKVIA